VKHSTRSEVYNPDAHKKRKVSGPLPLVMLDNGTDKHDSPEGTVIVTALLIGFVACILFFGAAALYWAMQ